MEMNAHIPQSITTSFELWNLARAPTQIVTPQTNGPIIGIVQDSLLGAFLLTRYSTQIPKQLAMNILALNPTFPGIMPESLKRSKKDNPVWGGRQLVTTIIPPINLQKFSNSFNDSITDTSEEYITNSRVIVRNGELVSGAIDKSVLGAKKEGSFAHVIWADLGPEQAKDFLSLIQKFTNKFLWHRGFSVGLGDIYPGKKLRTKMDHKILEGITEIKEIVDRIDSGTFVPPPDTTVEEYLEIQATEKLNTITLSVASEALKVLDPETNGLMGMITSGSKGEALNVGQMMGCVGQQNVDRKRIAKNYGRHRTLPFFHRDDTTPKSRGFVEHSFLQGLDPAEFFFHSMTGREGIIDTAIRTADSGYLSRRLMKAMEDIFVGYDSTVRNSNGQLIQFIFGEDGIDPMRIEKQKIETLFMDNDEIKEKYLLTKQDIKDYVDDKTGKEILDPRQAEETLLILNKEYKRILKDRDLLRYLLDKLEGDIEDKLYLPVNLQRLMVNAKNQFGHRPARSKTIRSDLNPLEVISKVKELTKKLPRIFSNQLRQNLEIQDNFNNAVTFLRMLIRSVFSCKRVIVEHNLTRVTFHYMLNQIEMKFMDAIVQPGEMVGAVASQSLGEPSTQLTLNTFHIPEWNVMKSQPPRMRPASSWVNGKHGITHSVCSG